MLKGSLESCSSYCGSIIVLLSLFDAISDLHAMDEKLLHDFVMRKGTWIFKCNKGIFNPLIIFIYVMEAFITLK